MLFKLLNGDYGLAKTFWIGCVLGNICWNAIFAGAYSLPLGKGLILLLGVGYALYFSAALIGLWTASGSYRGSKFWVVTSRLMIIVGMYELFTAMLFIFLT